MNKSTYHQVGAISLVAVVVIGVFALIASVLFVSSRANKLTLNSDSYSQVVNTFSDTSLCDRVASDTSDASMQQLKELTGLSIDGCSSAFVNLSKQNSANFLELELSCNAVDEDQSLLKSVDAVKDFSPSLSNECARDIIELVQPLE